MQSASTTPRQGLPQWARGDRFTRTDFNEAWAILDNAPGIEPVANFAALPADLTPAQHGSCFVQPNNRAVWMWYQPTSGSTGEFRRINTLGQLGFGERTTELFTTAKGLSAAPTVVTASATSVPGGRSLKVEVDCTLVRIDSTVPYGFFSLHYNADTTPIRTWQWEARYGTAVFLTHRIPASAVLPGTNHSFTVKVYGGTAGQPVGASGTIRCAYTKMTILEE